MSGTTAARRYAKALFALAGQQDAIDAVHADIDALTGSMGKLDDWGTFVQSPFGSLDKRGNLLDNAFTGRIHPLTLRFLKFLDRKHRITLLPDVSREWLQLYDASKNILRARVVSAFELSPEQCERLTGKLAARFGKAVILTTGIDIDMIGGMKITIGDQVIDYSIENQLQNLQKQMIYA